MRRWCFVCVLAFTSAAAPGLATNGVVIVVDDGAPPGGNGSARSPYTNLQDAVAAANASSQPVTIKVEPGEYVLAAPLLVERPLRLRHRATFSIVDPDGTLTSITLSVSNSRDAVWSGACSSNGNKTKTCTFTLNGNGSVTANVQ